MGTPMSKVKKAPRIVLEAEIAEKRFRYVLLPYDTIPWAVVEVLTTDAMGKDSWTRVNKEDAPLAMAAIVAHLAEALSRASGGADRG